MNIIKHGNGMRNFAHFVCPDCGCEFEELTMHCFTFNFQTMHSCPECGEHCVLDRQYRKKIVTDEDILGVDK